MKRKIATSSLRGFRQESDICPENESESAIDDDVGTDSEAGSDGSDIQELLEEDKDVTVSDKSSVPSKTVIKKRRRADKEGTEKPPTSEELNNLKETETLFHSSLFRMQVEELLKETSLKPKWKHHLEVWLQNLNKFLRELKEVTPVELTDQSWIVAGPSGTPRVPVCQKPFEVKGIFKFAPPSDIRIVGSYPVGLTSAQNVTVDVAAEIPQNCWQHGDYLNHRYHRKRALYLTFISMVLQEQPWIEELLFSYHHGDHMKPVLLIKPQGKAGKHFTISMMACPPSGFFKFSRFIPSKNNVRPSWFSEKDLSSQPNDDDNIPTPCYNMSVLMDKTMLSNTEFVNQELVDCRGLKEGIILLKVWLHQRHLDQGLGSFSGFIMTMFVIYLLKCRRLSKLMSSYQVVRTALLALSQAKWAEEGIHLVSDPNNNQPSLKDFHASFPVVFVDHSGYVNLCATMSLETFNLVKHEANLGMKALDSFSLDCFDALFMTPIPFHRKFDHLIQLTDIKCLTEVVQKLQVESEVLSTSGNFVVVAASKIASLLQKGLGKRIALLGCQRWIPKPWCIYDDPPLPSSVQNVTFGLLLNVDHSVAVLDKGPNADSSEAAEFRQFWGPKSELRRFPDGSITEGVVWTANCMAERRMIPEQVVKFLLHRHAGIPSSAIAYIGNQLECLLSLSKVSLPSGWPTYGTGEEANAALIVAYDSLARDLRKLKDMPLGFASVRGISPAFCFTEVFPPLPLTVQTGRQVTETVESCLIPKGNAGRTPYFVHPLEVVIQMEGSGKWPDSVDAVQRVKAAFYIKLTLQLRSQFCLTAVSFPAYVDVLKDGFVFRLVIACPKEISLLKQTKTPEGMIKVCNTEESQALEYHTVILPSLTSTLHGLQQQHTTFSAACRLAERWVAAHMLSDHVPEVCVQLIVAYLFLSPAPYSAPGSPQVAFQRFLYLLASHDWRTTPLIVNLNGEFQKHDYTKIQSSFTSQRTTLPPMFITTPYDGGTSVWTRRKPTAQILHRVVMLAQKSLDTLEKQLLKLLPNTDIKQIFRPPLQIYDVIIHLNPAQVNKLHLAVDIFPETRGVSLEPYQQSRDGVLPVVGYDPVQCYVKTLHECFSEFALFFYDNLGGTVVAVLWKPNILQAQPFKMSHINGCMIGGATTDATISIIPNVEAIVEDFAVLGAGLVRSIETKTEKWECS